ncbi:unnamed protein product [Ectocarpus sp. 4 AP-2014]
MVGGVFVNWFLLIVCGPPFTLIRPVTEFIERTGIVRRGSGCDRCQRSICCLPIKAYAMFFLCACLGPLPLASVLCWYLWRLLQCLCLFCWCLPRQAARRKTQLAVDRLGRFPGQRSWQARGWLIMMRARRQRSLARSKGRQARLRKLEHYDETNIMKYAMRDVMGGQIPPEIQLLEAGMLKKNLVLTVIEVVGINEEGLFRHIITYL